jgi:hypothetical protein
MCVAGYDMTAWYANEQLSLCVVFITHVGVVNLPSMATYSTFRLTFSFPLQNRIFKCTKPVTTDLTVDVNIAKLYRLDTFVNL